MSSISKGILCIIIGVSLGMVYPFAGAVVIFIGLALGMGGF
jgi:hypothetical protein